MTYLITAVAFIIIFSLLVLIHEFGHFYMAKRAGIKVEEFGMGLPPRMKTLFKKDETAYTLNWIPFGGFVRMYGEDDLSSKSAKDPDSFQSKTKLQRTGVIVAGVFMNFVLAVFLLGVGFSVGIPPILVTPEDVNQAIEEGILEVESNIVINEIVEGSAAANAGLLQGDQLIDIDDQLIAEPEDVMKLQSGKSEVTYTILRDDKEMDITISPDNEGKVGVSLFLQRIPINIHKVSYPVHIAFWKGFTESVRLSVLTVQMLGKVVTTLIQTQEVPDGVAGPVGILQLTHQYAQEGVLALLQLCAILSLSLAVINIMPFPALDGGRLLFIVYEIVTGKRPNQKVEGTIHKIGFLLLLALIFAVTWNDILRWFQ